MTKYGAAGSLWPERAFGRRRWPLSANAALCAGVAAVAVMVSAYSLADLVAGPRRETVRAPAKTAFAVADGSAPCWRDWPYIETECGARGSRAASAPATDGSGQPAAQPPGSQGAFAPAPVVPPAASAAAAPAPSAVVAAPRLSERDLTFTNGYLQRQAALGRAVQGAPAQRAKPPVVHTVARAKPRRSHVTVRQVYRLPDGRTVVVRRHYGRHEATRPDSFWAARGVRSAEIAPQRLGEPAGERRGWFW